MKIKRRNPGNSGVEDVAEMNKKFHGRNTEYIEDVVLEEKFPGELAQLGNLTQLELLVGEDEVIPIDFEEGVNVCCTADGGQIYFIGGDQSLDLDDLDLDIENEGKIKIELGEVYSISYFADKHHLTGPKQQKDGMEYIHEFGEEGGDRPILVYDTLNESLELVGGSYKVEEEGIKD